MITPTKPIKFDNLHLSYIVIVTLLAPISVQSDTSSNNIQNKQRTSALWSSYDGCFEGDVESIEKAVMIAIRTNGDSYNVAGCVKYGCRLSVPEFGKKTHHTNYKYDPKFVWLSDTVFETVVYGKNTRFYQCITK